MTEERLRSIAFDMEPPLNRLDAVRILLSELVDRCPTSEERQADIYLLLERNLSGDLDEIRQLWRELFALVGPTLCGLVPSASPREIISL